MDAGKVVEFAPPLALLERSDGYFTRLLSETGQVTFDKLKKMAVEKAEREGSQSKFYDVFADTDNIVDGKPVSEEHFEEKDNASHTSIGHLNRAYVESNGNIPQTTLQTINEVKEMADTEL